MAGSDIASAFIPCVSVSWPAVIILGEPHYVITEQSAQAGW